MIAQNTDPVKVEMASAYTMKTRPGPETNQLDFLSKITIYVLLVFIHRIAYSENSTTWFVRLTVVFFNFS